MSHFELTAQLEREEYRILNAIEVSMRKFEWVPMKNITFYSRLDAERVQFWLDKVHKRDLILRHSGGLKNEGYALNSKGYDLLAARALAEEDVVLSIGNSLGVGKESDVYQGIGPGDEFLALKFHRIGRTSFRNIKAKRDYVAGKFHTSWLYMSRVSATREAGHLKRLNEVGADVPVLRGHNRHVVVMKQYDGQEIQEFDDVDDAQGVFEQVVRNVKKCYQEARLIHCDLCEYNIIYTRDKHVVIIDWPQAVATDHPNARLLLRRDVENVCRYFGRLGVEADPDAVTAEITGPGAGHAFKGAPREC
ncbi:MAG: serine/threonine protein kinase [Candidatus Lokiarchaeota archaeon]|nr:serine/threonine protein kinase [Candidatus Lokiarchaeota archaeon]